MDNAVLLGLEHRFSCLDLFDGFGQLKGHGAQFGVRHHSTGPENLAQFSNGPHHVRCCHDPVELEPSALDLLSQFIGTDGYVVSGPLIEAVNCSIALERPLLVKGEPGTGKTLLATHIAQGLGLPMEQWHIKSTSKASPSDDHT